MPFLPQSALKEYSTVTEADIAFAVAMWYRLAPAFYRPLMDAPLAGQPARFTWDAKVRLYVYTQSGRHIPALEIRNRAIEPFIQSVKDMMRAATAGLQSKAADVDAWQAEMMQTIKLSQLAAWLIANGGQKNATKSDNDNAALTILALLIFFNLFVKDILAKKQPMNGFLLLRSGLYANAARDAYEEGRRQGEQIYLGKTQERRVLDPQANHCHTVEDWIGCPELAAKGWRPIGSLPRLMDTPCVSNCRCHFEYK